MALKRLTSMIFLLLTGFAALGGCQKLRRGDEAALKIDGDTVDIGDTRIRATVAVIVEKRSDKDPSGNGSFTCSGVAVAPRIVLTAAHCLEDATRTVVMHHVHSNGDLKAQYAVKKVSLANPVFLKNHNTAYDLVALVLATPLDPRYVSLARLPDLSDRYIKAIIYDPRARFDCRLIFAIAGCGSHGGLPNPSLRTVLGSSSLVDSELYGHFGGPLFALLAKTAPGDSGGPLFTRSARNEWTLIGTLAGLDRTSDGSPISLYVPLIDHLDWLREVLLAN